jgi:hypothetical protein
LETLDQQSAKSPVAHSLAVEGSTEGVREAIESSADMGLENPHIVSGDEKSDMGRLGGLSSLKRSRIPSESITDDSHDSAADSEVSWTFHFASIKIEYIVSYNTNSLHARSPTPKQGHLPKSDGSWQMTVTKLRTLQLATMQWTQIWQLWEERLWGCFKHRLQCSQVFSKLSQASEFILREEVLI